MQNRNIYIDARNFTGDKEEKEDFLQQVEKFYGVKYHADYADWSNHHFGILGIKTTDTSAIIVGFTNTWQPEAKETIIFIDEMFRLLKGPMGSMELKTIKRLFDSDSEFEKGQI